MDDVTFPTDSTAPARSGAIVIRSMAERDWPQVRDIYTAGIESGHSTFEVEAPDSWERFISTRHEHLSLVAVDDAGLLLGWTTLSPTSHREVFAGVAENSIYIHPAAHGRGIGTRLLGALVQRADEAGIWTIQAGIFPENTASIRLHEHYGFRVLGRRERVGLMRRGPLAGQWHDLVLMERRVAV